MPEDPAASVTDSSRVGRKIVTPDHLVHLLSRLRTGRHDASPPVVVQCHGCFDIVHPGHIRYLQFARTQGDVLVVSITGDACIRKGAQRPYIPQELRAENLAALALVDYVVIDPNPTAAELLESVRPDVYVKGREYATSDDPRFLVERSVVESNGGRVVFSSGDVVFSSSEIIENIAPDHDLDARRLSAVCARHGIDADSLRDSLERFGGMKVVVLGDAVVERYVSCDTDTVSTEAPMMSLRQLEERDFLGGAAGIAVQLAALGARPVLMTALGEGALSTSARATLAEAGVEVRSLEIRDDLPMKARYLVDGQKLFRTEKATRLTLHSADERRMIRQLGDALPTMDALVMHDAGYGVISPGLLIALSAELRSRIPFVAGGCCETQPNPGTLKNVDLLCCSERRLRRAVNDRHGSLSTIAYRLLEMTQARQLIVTVGPRGVVTFDRPSHDRNSMEWRGRLQSEYLPAFSNRLVDRFGAGEALLTISSLCATAGGNLMQAAYLGSMAAAIAVERLGPAPMTLDELKARVTGRFEIRGSRGTLKRTISRPLVATGLENEVPVV